MTHLVDQLIAGLHRDFTSAEQDAIETLDFEICEIQGRIGHRPSSVYGLAGLVLAQYARLKEYGAGPIGPDTRDHRFVACLADLPEEARAAVADLAGSPSLRRAMITADDPVSYLQAQFTDGWFVLNAWSWIDSLPDLRTALQEPGRLTPALCQTLAPQVSHVVYGGARPGDESAFYVRPIAPPPFDIHLTGPIYVVIERATNRVVEEFASAPGAMAAAERLNRHPATAALYAEIRILERRLGDNGHHEAARAVAASARTLATQMRDATLAHAA